MVKNGQKCFQCGRKGFDMFGHTICNSCKSKLKFFTDSTIKKYYLKNPEKFSREIKTRLEKLEKDYIKKKIKLLHVQKQIKNITQK